MSELSISPTISVRRRLAVGFAEAHWGDRIFHGALKVIAWSLILVIIGIFAMLIKMAYPALSKFGLHFFFGDDWNPPMDTFGVLPFVYGTVVTSLIALLVATPLSIGTALFLTELAPRGLGRVVGFLVEMLAAIPSVVYGLWGIFILAPFMQTQVQPKLSGALGPTSTFAVVVGQILSIISYPVVLVLRLFNQSQISFGALNQECLRIAGKIFSGPSYGVGMLTAGLVLAIMIVPTIAAVSREIFVTVSPQIKEAAMALGATRWEMIKLAVVKTSRSGILGAVILGLGRALSETMAVTMVIGNRNEITAAIMSPGQTLASVIANEYPEASGLHLASLAGVGLALFAISLVINSFARIIIWRFESGSK